jgi:hypothetical protein
MTQLKILLEFYSSLGVLDHIEASKRDSFVKNGGLGIRAAEQWLERSSSVAC